MKKIWEQIKPEILRLMKERPDIEVACNIYVTFPNEEPMFYIDDINYGDIGQVNLPTNPFVIGDFHTHVADRNVSVFFSPWDIRDSIRNKVRYIFLGYDKSVYGFDMNRVKKMIVEYKKNPSRKNLKKIQQHINTYMDCFI